MAYPGSGYQGSYDHQYGGRPQHQQYQQYDQRTQYEQQYQQQRPMYNNYGGDGPPPPPTGHQNFIPGNGNLQFEYSDLHGKKKALLIGINYIGSKNALRGCINE